MIEDERIAAEVSRKLLASYNDLEKTVAVVARTGSDAELFRFRRSLALVLASMIYDVLNPLYERHPHLKPRGWDEG